MANVFVDSQHLTNIANSIRSKKSVTTKYRPSEMAAAIDTIGSGGVTPTGTLQVTANGTYDVTQYASAEVNVASQTYPTWQGGSY